MRFLLFNKDEEYVSTITDASYAHHFEEINGEDTLTIKTRDGVVEKNFRILYPAKTGIWKEYIVKEIFESNDHFGLEKELYCESSFYETLGDFIDDRKPRNATATEALSIVLEPTRWELGTVHDLGLRSTTFYRASCKECVHKIAEVWAGEIQTRVTVSGNKITARYVDLLSQRGSDNGQRFTFTKNLDSVSRTVLRDDVVTALYGYGKGEFIEETGGWGRRIDFKDLNDGKAYVTDETARLTWGRNSPTGKVHVFGKVEFDDCEDPAELLELTIAKLAEISQPQVAYDCLVRDLGKVDLGDSVRVIDKEFDPELRVNARVVQIDRDLLEEERSQIVFGNYRPGITDSLAEYEAYLSGFRDKAGVWDRAGAFGADGTLNADWLNGLVDELNNRMNSQGGYVYVSDDGQGLITYDKPVDQNPTMAIQLLGGAFRIANGKKGDGSWDWRTFGDGDGFVADLIVAGMLKGGKVTFNLTDGTLLIGNSSSDYSLYWNGSTLTIKGTLLLSDGTDIGEAVEDITEHFSETGDFTLLENGYAAFVKRVTGSDPPSTGDYSTTTIDGGKIKAYSVTANKINVVALDSTGELDSTGGTLKVSNANGTVEISPSNPLKVTDKWGSLVGGLAVIDGELSLFANKLTNNPTADFYLKTGTFTGEGSKTFNGMIGVRNGVDTAFLIGSNYAHIEETWFDTPQLSIRSIPYPISGGLMPRTFISVMDQTSAKPTSFQSGSWSWIVMEPYFIQLKSGNSTIELGNVLGSSPQNRVYLGTSNHSMGIDSTGPYFTYNGTTTYFHNMSSGGYGDPVSMTSGQNLDNYTSTGVWYTAGYTMTNRPSGYSNYALLRVTAPAGGYAIQEYLCATGGQFRVRSAGSWGSWKAFA